MAPRHPYQRGDVVLIQFPFSGTGASKNRPAVVTSSDTYHDQWDELLVVALTSRSPKSIRPTDYALKDWRPAGLSQPSWMRSHLATVGRRLVVQKVGSLTSADLRGVETACESHSVSSSQQARGSRMRRALSAIPEV